MAPDCQVPEFRGSGAGCQWAAGRKTGNGRADARPRQGSQRLGPCWPLLLGLCRKSGTGTLARWAGRLCQLWSSWPLSPHPVICWGAVLVLTTSPKAQALPAARHPGSSSLVRPRNPSWSGLHGQLQEQHREDPAPKAHFFSLACILALLVRRNI